MVLYDYDVNSCYNKVAYHLECNQKSTSVDEVTQMRCDNWKIVLRSQRLKE